MLARYVTKWSKACDKQLHRLVSYMKTTRDWNLESFVGDSADQCRILLYTDTDFASDLQTSRCTSGAFVAIVGRNTFAPICALCKKQTAVSHSSTESEIVALDTALRTEGLPIMTFWETVKSLLF